MRALRVAAYAGGLLLVMTAGAAFLGAAQGGPLVGVLLLCAGVGVMGLVARTPRTLQRPRREP